MQHTTLSIVDLPSIVNIGVLRKSRQVAHKLILENETTDTPNDGSVWARSKRPSLLRTALSTCHLTPIASGDDCRRCRSRQVIFGDAKSTMGPLASMPPMRPNHRFSKRLYGVHCCDNHILIEGDKNVAPCAIERDTWIERGIKDHLRKDKYYRKVSHEEASNIMKLMEVLFKNIMWVSERLSKAGEKYLKRAMELFVRVPQFYMLAKVHKKP